jgi:hypothetical protein
MPTMARAATSRERRAGEGRPVGFIAYDRRPYDVRFRARLAGAPSTGRSPPGRLSTGHIETGQALFTPRNDGRLTHTGMREHDRPPPRRRREGLPAVPLTRAERTVLGLTRSRPAASFASTRMTVSGIGGLLPGQRNRRTYTAKSGEQRVYESVLVRRTLGIQSRRAGPRLSSGGRRHRQRSLDTG